LKFDKFDIKRLGHEISSNGLFMYESSIGHRIYEIPVVDYSLYESSFGHIVYEISSSGLFMVSVQYWTWNV
jgi:hypothetical protein